MQKNKPNKFHKISRKKCNLIYFIIPLALLLCSLTTAFCDTIKSNTAAKNPWQIKADQVTYNMNTKVYTASGDIFIFKDDMTLTAEAIHFNQETMQALLEGNVRVKSGQDTLIGDQVDINLNTGVGTITHGSIFIEKNNFFIRGDKILKTGENSYAIANGSMTSCVGDTPAWKITGKELELTLEDFGTVKHAAFWVKKLPVLYFPYFVFPVKIKRQSGFLIPQAGYSSRNGIHFILPFYWAINKSSDATVYYHHIQNRGEKIGLEYRYALSPQSKGTMMYDFLDDRHIDDGSGNSSNDWGYPDDGYLRPNSDRYWFRSKFDQSLPKKFTAKLDLDIVSDQDFLREFSDGYSGYNAAKKHFLSEFGRDIDSKDDPIRENNLLINRIWAHSSLNAEVIWNDNVILRRQGDEDPTLQQLPSVSFDSLKQPVFDNHLSVYLDSNYTNFYRKDGDTGQRFHIHPRIYIPLKAKNYFTFEPSIGLLATGWYTDPEMPDTSEGPTDGYQHREVIELKADLATDIFNVFDIHGNQISKIKHTITPRLDYSYIPDENQTDYPVFDDTDLVESHNILTLSITNLLISKWKNPIRPDASARSSRNSFHGSRDFAGSMDTHNNVTRETHSYNQFLRFRLQQSYDFDKRSDPDTDPLLPLFARMDIEPVSFLTLHTDSEYSYDRGTFISHNIYCKIRNKHSDYFLVEHRYDKDNLQSIYFKANRTITRTLRVYGDYERNLTDGESIETMFGGVYMAQCWSLELFYKNEEYDKKIGFMVNLEGLTKLGASL